jgi:hypothetical protein
MGVIVGGRRLEICTVLVAAWLTTDCCAAQDASGLDARDSIREALAELDAFRNEPQLVQLTRENPALRGRLDKVSRKVKDAERQISRELEFAVLGMAHDMTFHLFSMTRDLRAIQSAEKVKEKFEALAKLDDSTLYRDKLKEVNQRIAETSSRLNGYASLYADKMNGFKAYGPNFGNKALDEIARTNGNTDEGRLILDIINAHYRNKGILTPQQAIKDVRRALGLT